MKQIWIHMFLDESGNASTTNFVVAGFYVINEDNNKNITALERIKHDIKTAETNIKKYRAVEEPNEMQFIVPGNADKEVKWSWLTPNNRLYLASALNNRNQKNIAIVANSKKWKTKNGHPLNLDFTYNYLVKTLIKFIYKKHDLEKYDQVVFDINIDQRSDVPKESFVSDEEHQLYSGKAFGLKDYLATNLFFSERLQNLKIKTKQWRSNDNCWVRYADYLSGYIASSIRFYTNEFYGWKQLPMNLKADIAFDKLIKKIPTYCYSAIISHETLGLKVVKRLCDDALKALDK